MAPKILEYMSSPTIKINSFPFCIIFGNSYSNKYLLWCHTEKYIRFALRKKCAHVQT